ncbi:GyrI-like domain-containing protein [Shewanella alkalitolerans]|uniref:GyrI-like domain-containing protein n=1 Tax=Shewanella alkalitolerans TaxID=2864209 RepID=UPI001C6576A4|nr:GyrI-like domain-containing protein [Shewanella alkalitolerans]QYJ96469.1 GyrI-like domain-containing protein [Shewanella alkalitolerans]
MKTINLAPKSLVGMSVRTNNGAESEAATQKIAPLWQAFMGQYGEQIFGKLPVYGVYYDYASDMDGDYSLMTAVEVGTIEHDDKLTPLTLEGGNYLCFSATGEMPQAVISLWQQIWAYFQRPDCPYRRQYLTDFECYAQPDSVDIFIGVHVEV